MPGCRVRWGKNPTRLSKHTDVILFGGAPRVILYQAQALEACLRAGEIAVTKRILFTLLPLFALCAIAVCSLSSCNKSTEPANSAPAAQPAADASPPDDIPPVDPIWDAMARKQAHLDQVEKIRTGNKDAVSCQKAVPGAHRAMKVDTSHCNAVQLRIEKQAEHDQLFDHMVKTLRHEN